MTHTSKKSQKLTLQVVSKSKDCFGVWEVNVLINSKPYTYNLTSEFAARQIDKLVNKKPGKALALLKQFNLKEETDVKRN